MTPTRATAACLAALASICAFLALRLGLWSAGRPGAGMFPFVSALLLLAFSATVFFKDSPDSARDEPIDPPRLVRYGAAVAIFALIMKPLGTALASIGLLIVVLRGIEGRRWITTLAVAIGIAVLSWGLFDRLLGVPLPQGILEWTDGFYL